MNQKQRTVNQVFEEQGIALTEPALRIPSKMIVQDYNESKDDEYERNQIIKKHRVFTNEIKHNYTTVYLDTVSDLLFKNENKYHIKRNRLNVSTRHYGELPQIKNVKNSKVKGRNDSSLLSLMSASSKKRSNLTLSHNNSPVVYYEKEKYQTMTLTSSREREKRLVEMVHLSNKMNKIYLRNFKNLLNRRIDNTKGACVIYSSLMNNSNSSNNSSNSNSNSSRTPRIMLKEKIGRNRLCKNRI